MAPSTEKEKLEHPLTANQIKLIREYDQAVRDLNAQKQGALQAIVREAGLTGVWNLDVETGVLTKEQTQ